MANYSLYDSSFRAIFKKMENSSLKELTEEMEREEKSRKFQEELQDYLYRKRGPEYSIMDIIPTREEYIEFLKEQEERKKAEEMGVTYTPYNYYDNKLSTQLSSFVDFIKEYYFIYVTTY